MGKEVSEIPFFLGLIENIRMKLIINNWSGIFTMRSNESWLIIYY